MRYAHIRLQDVVLVISYACVIACTYKPKNAATLDMHLVNFIYFLMVCVTFKLKDMHSISWYFSVSRHKNIPLWRVRNISFTLLLKGCNYVGVTVPIYNYIIVCHCVALTHFLWKQNGETLYIIQCLPYFDLYKND